eukprot:TRINITY_DN32322_c0_g1_i1.p1 TRINITY_DN32322_c0_g1~~TRINITY_DN32322_c0_g1_i1.p1  ORF type:complete len:418 (+),score=154.76 TRINITY_DN32322_c0_g1_i1:54-1307(+)
MANIPRMKKTLAEATGDMAYITIDDEYAALKEDVKGARACFKELGEALEGLKEAAQKVGAAAGRVYEECDGFLRTSREQGRRQVNDMLAMLCGQLRDVNDHVQREAVPAFAAALDGECSRLVDAYEGEWKRVDKLKAARRKSRDEYDHRRNVRDAKIDALRAQKRDNGASPSYRKKSAKADAALEDYNRRNDAAVSALRSMAERKDRVLGAMLQTYLDAAATLFGVLHHRYADLHALTVRPMSPPAVDAALSPRQPAAATAPTEPLTRKRSGASVSHADAVPAPSATPPDLSLLAGRKRSGARFTPPPDDLAPAFATSDDDGGAAPADPLLIPSPSFSGLRGRLLSAGIASGKTAAAQQPWRVFDPPSYPPSPRPRTRSVLSGTLTPEEDSDVDLAPPPRPVSIDRYDPDDDDVLCS